MWNELEPSTHRGAKAASQQTKLRATGATSGSGSVHETTPPESKKLALPLPHTPWVPRSRMVQPPQRRPRKPGVSLLRLPVSGHMIEAIQPQQATEPFSFYGRGEGTHGGPTGTEASPRMPILPHGGTAGCLLAGHLENTHIRKAASRPSNL